MQRQEYNKRINYITFINVVSAFAVLVMHTNGCFWKFSRTELYWKTANVIECIFYFAVSLFFMLSGITLMDFYERSTLKEYFIKRVKKAVIPFLSWSLIGVLWNMWRGRIAFEEINFKYLYQGITGTTIVNIFWLFVPLFTIYLCIPLFAAVEKEKGIFLFGNSRTNFECLYSVSRACVRI